MINVDLLTGIKTKTRLIELQLMNTVVCIAVKVLLITQETTENIAVENVTSKLDMVVIVMSKDDFNKELLYQTTMNMACEMLKNALITKEEYTVIDTIFIEKYNPTLGTLFTELT